MPPVHSHDLESILDQDKDSMLLYALAPTPKSQFKKL